MTKKTENIEPTKKAAKMINTLQIVTLFKLSFYDREVVKIKYKGKEMTEKQWKDALKKDNINFVF